MPPDARFAWLALLIAAWIIGGLIVVDYAFSSGLIQDAVVSPYHLPFYLGLLVLGLISLVLVARAVRGGRGWRHTFPQGYGVLGASFVALAIWPIAEIGWGVGIGIKVPSVEGLLAPSRLLAVGGAILVAVGPLRASLALPTSILSAASRWAAVISATLVFVVLGAALGFEPAQDHWLERAASSPVTASEIWVMNSDGSKQTRLIEAADGFEIGDVAWSPDGTKIVYTRSKSSDWYGVPTDDVAIWIAAADGSQPRMLVQGNGWYWLPHWSPDGAWIIYTIDGRRGPGSGAGVQGPDLGFGQPPAFGQPPSVAPNVDVWRILAAGTGTPVRLTQDPSEDRAGVYSPDGRHILFDSTRAGGRPGIYVMDADGANAVRVTSLGDDWGGTWSPDGTRIAFNSSPTGGPEDVSVTAYPASGDPLRLTEDPSNDLAPSWSPDGSRLAFVTNRNGDSDIWSMAADGSDQRNLSRTVGASESLCPGGGAWGPDGRIVYQRTQDPPATADRLVRENLAIFSILLGAAVLAALVLLLVRIGMPFGSVAVLMGCGAAVAAMGSGQWRFVPPFVIGGLLADVLIRLAPPDRKALVAGAGSAAAFVLSAGVTVIITTGMAWTPTLLVGVAIVAAGLGAGLTVLDGRRPRSGPEAIE
jgi:TolB protein